jgi:NAD(P)H dehydrogenase (quinone)
MILVTGANGQLAGWVIKNLLNLTDAKNIAVCSRSTDSAFTAELRERGVDVRVGDFDRRETLPGAMAGITKVLIIPTYATNDVRLSQNISALKAAKEAGVKHIVYPSFLNAKPNSHAEHSQLVHYPTEQAIISSGLTYTILRHALYADITIGDLDDTLAKGVFRRPGGTSACAYVAREDLGLSAATALVKDGHENKIYTETMTRTYTGADIAALMSEVFETPVRYESIRAVDWADFMIKEWGVPEELAKSSIGSMRAVETGEFDIVTNDYQTIVGHPPRDFRQFLVDLKASRSK